MSLYNAIAMFKSGYHSVTTLNINKSYKIYWTFNDNWLYICKACVNFQIVHGLLLQFSLKMVRTLLSWKVYKEEGGKGKLQSSVNMRDQLCLNISLNCGVYKIEVETMPLL
jgi:hypothetical protein